MANLISRLIAFSSGLTSELYALRKQAIAGALSQSGTSGSGGAWESRQARRKEADDFPSWPPPEDMYWGM